MTGYIDVNSFLGEWPSRRLNGSPPPPRPDLVSQRLMLMDRLEIDHAAVSLLEGVWLKDSGTANDELHQLTRGHTNRFFPVYTLNPTFPTWREHLGRCVASYGLTRGTCAIRLLPGYHGYALDAAGDCLDRLAELDVPVLLTIQLEDARMQHPGMRVPDVKPDAIVDAIQRRPKLRWLVVNCLSAQITAICKQLPEDGQVWFDIARVQGPLDCVRLLRDQVSARRLVFGTNLPLHVPHSPIMELADARLSPEEDAVIRSGNARTALGI